MAYTVAAVGQKVAQNQGNQTDRRLCLAVEIHVIGIHQGHVGHRQRLAGNVIHPDIRVQEVIQIPRGDRVLYLV